MFSSPWYMDRKFARYWEHYDACFSWMKAHHQSVAASENPAETWAKWKTASAPPTPTPQTQPLVPAPQTQPIVPAPQTQPMVPEPETEASHSLKQKPTRSQKRKSSTRRSPRQRNGRNKRRNRTESDSMASQSEAVEADDDLLCDIPFTDDLLKFLAESAKHRKQRDKLKRKAEKEERENKHTEDFDKSYKATTQAPKERPGLRRTAEMKVLYGKGAAMIHGMETAMQLTFDRNCDLKQSRHWPNLPLNIKFN